METEAWGLPAEAVDKLGERLRDFWGCYGALVRTQTRDTSEYGQGYISGLLRMPTARNMASIGRTTGIREQNMQHFMSQSPWDGQAVIGAVRSAVAGRRELAGGVLILDESGDEKFGESSVGVARQYNGRHGQVERSQVGVFLSYAKGNIWSWIDGELYVPERWFSPAYSQRREKAGLPAQRRYQKKTELGWQLIERAVQSGLDFVAVCFDSYYGHEATLRDQCRQAGIEYYADIPNNTLIYLRDPSPAFQPNHRGYIPKHPSLLEQWAYRVEELSKRQLITWHNLCVRETARGHLVADFAVLPVWTVRQDGQVVSETLLLRRDGNHITYTLTNANPDTPLNVLAARKSQRYFVERTIQDAKSEFGWDEFQALKYRAWQHHLALTILASWFIAETRLDWSLAHPPDPTLLDLYATDVLPSLSVANVRQLLRAALPLPQLSPDQAIQLVAKHLDNRTRSRRSRLNSRSDP
jgi:SRSO17 transposase